MHSLLGLSLTRLPVLLKLFICNCRKWLAALIHLHRHLLDTLHLIHVVFLHFVMHLDLWLIDLVPLFEDNLINSVFIISHLGVLDLQFSEPSVVEHGVALSSCHVSLLFRRVIDWLRCTRGIISTYSVGRRPCCCIGSVKVVMLRLSSDLHILEVVLNPLGS